MIDRFSIENFKGYKEKCSFCFPGLTYLTGANNSGKSTIIQSLYMLASSNSNNYDSTLLTNTSNYHLGSFNELLNKNCRNTESINFEIDFDKYTLSVKFSKNEHDDYNPVLNELTVYSETKNDKNFFSFCLNSEELRDKSISSNKYKLLLNDKFVFDDIYITGLAPNYLPEKKPDVKNYKNFFKLLDLRFSLLNSLNNKCIKYLKAYREDAKMAYMMNGSNASDIGISGEFTAEAIYKMSHSGYRIDFDDRMLFSDALQYWISKIIGEEYSLSVEYSENMLRMKIIEHFSKNENTINRKFDITQVGFGFSQIIPIITLILLSKKNDLLLIENPEVHLHPKLQANLADLFIYAIKNGRKLIIETHSEHLISRTRNLVKSDESSNRLNDKINIYFFEKKFFNDDCYIHSQEITIDDVGQLSAWPKDFFDQSFIENMRLIQ